MVTETISKITGGFSTDQTRAGTPGCVSGWPISSRTSGYKPEGVVCTYLFIHHLHKPITILLPICYLWTQGVVLEAQNRSYQVGKWRPGQSGNLKGRPPKRIFDDRLREALASKRGARASALVERLLGEAMKGTDPYLS
jgi:hypothetical protein